MPKLRTILLFLFLSSVCLGQWPHYKPSNLPENYERLHDSTAVKYIIMDLIHSANEEFFSPFIWNLSTEMLNKYPFKNLASDKRYRSRKRDKNIFNLKGTSYSISISNDMATVEFNYSDHHSKDKKQETITLTKYSGHWSITGSTSFLKYVFDKMMMEINDIGSSAASNATIQNSKSDNGNSVTQPQNNVNGGISNVISSFTFSDYALTQIPAWGTDYLTINRSVTLNDPNISRKLFHTISNAKVVKTVAGDDFAVCADYGWDRLIYGSRNGLWIKSYGEQPNEQQIRWPDNVQLDKNGNIFLIANSPRTVYRLLYNESTGNISLVQTYNLPEVIEPSDICLDYDSYNGTNNNIFWLSDIQGNAICKYSWTGQELGKYTQVISTNKTLYFNHPTKILIDNGLSLRIAVIDSDQKRMITITNIHGFFGNTISGDFQECTFDGQLNVSLSSIGHFDRYPMDGTALWVSDKNNGTFHIFDGGNGPGYLGTVKSLNSQQQWVNPKGLVSTSMSNSNGDYPSGMTIDNWDNSYGINTYLQGADMLNPKVLYNMDELPKIYTSIPTKCVIKKQLYDSNNNLILDEEPELYSQGLYFLDVADLYGSVNPIVKYKAQYIISPMNYYPGGNFPMIKDVWYAFKVGGTISDPVIANNQITWNVTVNSGSGDFSYKWYRQDQGSSIWNELPTFAGQTCSLTNYNVGFTIRCDVTDNFNNNAIQLMQLFTPVINKSGQISQSEKWEGIINVTSDVTIMQGITLTIVSGTRVNFLNNSSLIIDGWANLKTLGTAESKVILDFKAISYSPLNRILASANSSIYMKHTEVKNVVCGIWATDAEVYVDSCDFHDMYKPLYLINRSYSSTINNTKISNTSSEAIWLVNNLAYLTNNKISNNYYEGLRMISGADAYLSQNTIEQNQKGISSATGSLAILNGYNLVRNSSNYSLYSYFDGAIGADGGNNSFIPLSTGKYAAAGYGGIIVAANNYWGVVSPDPASFFSDIDGYIDYSSPMQNDNGTGSTLNKSGGQTELQLAYRELMKENYDNAEKLFIKIVKNQNEDSKYALNGLTACYRMSKKEGLKQYLKDEYKLTLRNTKDDKYRHYLELYTNCLIQDGLYDEALDNLGVLRKNFELERELSKDLYFQEGLIQLAYKNNFEKAISAFQKAKTDNPDERTRIDIDLLLAAHNAGVFSSILNSKNKGNIEKSEGDKKANILKNIPADYELYPNFPNPFNPTTTIYYALPKDSKVELTIYNIMGNEVRSYTINSQSAGYHNLLWDGKNMNNERAASGTYIYRLRAVSYENGRIFEKSAKMVLVK